MTGRRTHALAVALTLAAASLSACGGSGEEEPTTQSVEEYAQTEAAKSTSRSKPSPSATRSTTEADSSSEAGGEPSASESSSAPDDLPPVNQPTDKAQVAAATKFVKAYLDTFNKAVRKPSTRDALDSYTAPECKSCSSLKGVVEQLASRKQRFDGDGLVWRSSVAETTDSPETLELFVVMSQPSTKVLDSKGKVVNHVKKRDRMEKAFSVRGTHGSLEITAIKRSV